MVTLVGISASFQWSQLIIACHNCPKWSQRSLLQCSTVSLVRTWMQFQPSHSRWSDQIRPVRSVKKRVLNRLLQAS